jgi:TolB-like protein/cytochrome c-type biogenesis protein CcmH/NrfG
MGDGVLVEFASAVNAVACAVELQKQMAAANDGVADERRIVLRVGINVGDVVVDGGDLYGDAVIIAVRLQEMAESGGVCVSGGVHEQVGHKLPLAFEDLGPCEVKNLARPVRVLRVKKESQESEQPAAFQHPPAKTCIAVLPFTNMSGDPGQEFFADGLTEDVIAALSRVSGFLVIARTSTFAYKGQPLDVKRVARELRVHYIMEGSVRRATDRLRVTAQLIEAATGHHVWVERYDRSVENIFEIQDEITRGVAASTETQILFAERRAAERRAPGDLKARDLAMQAWAKSYDGSFAEASDLVERAIRIDPRYPRAHMVRANVFLHRMVLGDIPHDNANVARGLDLANTARDLDPQDEWAHWVMAIAYGEAGRLEDAVAECERGLEINPNSSNILADMGEFLAPLGRTQEAIDACRLALRLNPRDPSNYWRHSTIATAHFVAADYEQALYEAKRVVRLHPGFLRSALIWAAAAAALGNVDEAQAAVAHCLAQQSDLHLDKVVPDIMLRFARAEDHERLLAMLRKAGLPE